MLNKLTTSTFAFLLVLIPTIPAIAQELPPEAFNPAGDGLPPEAYQNIPTGLDSFGDESISGFSPYDNGSFGSLDFDYYTGYAFKLDKTRPRN